MNRRDVPGVGYESWCRLRECFRYHIRKDSGVSVATREWLVDRLEEEVASWLVEEELDV